MKRNRIMWGFVMLVVLTTIAVTLERSRAAASKNLNLHRLDPITAVLTI